MMIILKDLLIIIFLNMFWESRTWTWACWRIHILTTPGTNFFLNPVISVLLGQPGIGRGALENTRVDQFVEKIPLWCWTISKRSSRRIVNVTVSDYLVSTDGDVYMEAMEAATKMGLKHFVPGRDSMSVLLSSREARTMVELNERYEQKYKQPATSNPNLVYGLGDNADFQSWSAGSGKVPTYRLSTSNSRYWLPAHQRWMTAKERLISMGWPVCPAMSHALDVPLIGASDPKRAFDLIKVIGNSMHLQSTGVLQLIALACFGPS